MNKFFLPSNAWHRFFVWCVLFSHLIATYRNRCMLMYYLRLSACTLNYEFMYTLLFSLSFAILYRAAKILTVSTKTRFAYIALYWYFFNFLSNIVRKNNRMTASSVNQWTKNYENALSAFFVCLLIASWMIHNISMISIWWFNNRASIDCFISKCSSCHVSSIVDI